MKIVNILPDSHTIPCVPSTPIHPDNLAQALETFIDSVEVYATRAKQGRDKLLDLEWAIRSGRIAAEDAARERNRDIGHKVTVVVKKRGEEFTESDSLSFHPDIMNALKVQSDLHLLRAPIIAQSDALVLPLINAGYPDAAEAVELLGSKAKDSIFETHELDLLLNRLRETGICEGDLITPVWTNYRATLRITLRQLQATPTQEADGAAPMVDYRAGDDNEEYMTREQIYDELERKGFIRGAAKTRVCRAIRKGVLTLNSENTISECEALEWIDNLSEYKPRDIGY